MPWIVDNYRPIYIQLIDEIKQRIITGTYPIGDKLPSVRDLASEASVNPNTMQKALSELEREGLVFSNRTTGRFITEDQALVTALREQLATEQITIFLRSMKSLGFSKQDLIELLSKTDINF